ncbi:MAG: glycosyltransferase family 39 protein [Thermodesulfobacteriota bacterium]
MTPERQNSDQARTGHRLGFLLLALAGLGLFFFRLGTPGLMDPDEGRYAEIAREMWVLRDWLIPHLNFLPYLEKPPLVYWLTALSFGAWGCTEWAARLPVALSALGGIFGAYWLGRAFWGAGPGLVSALILTTSLGYVVLGRVLTLDMTLALFLNLGIGLGYLALSRERRELLPWAYLALALAVLSKGPVALVLAGLIWGVWALIARRPLIRPLWHPGGLLLLALVSLPWFVWVAWQYPDFLRFFVWEQHFGRFLTASFHHQQPVYYYLPVLFGLLLPWGWLLPWALGSRRPDPQGDRLFLWVWAGVILLFFSLSRGKLAPYILPALLPLALLLGEALHGLTESGRHLWASRGLTLSLAVWALTAWVLVGLYFRPPAFLAPEWARLAPLSPYLPLGLIILALTPTAALIWRRLTVLLLGALLFGTLLPGGIEGISQRRSPREMGLALKSHWQPGAALIGLQLYSQGVSFYSGQVFHLLDFPSELDFGRRLDPGTGLFFADPAAMTAFVHSRALTFFFLKDKAFPRLQGLLAGNFQTLARYKDCLLVAYKGK